MARKMTDSGIKWIGKVPEGWKVERIQWHADEINDKNNPIRYTTVLSLTNNRGVIPYEDKGAQGNKSKENLAEYKIAYKGTIVANSMNILIGSVGLSKYDGCVSPVYYVFKAKSNTDVAFLSYIFQMPQFQRELRRFANGILEIRLRVSASDILKRKLAFPPLSEQKEIADYLDKECGRIEGLRDKIKREIERLDAYKKSAITEAVCRGLNPKAKMKDSGIKWIGKVPEGWKVDKIKYCLILSKDRNPGDAEVLSLYREYGVIPKDSRDDNHNVTSEDTSKYRFVRRGDFVINKMKAWQGSMAVSDYDGIVSPAYYVYRFRNNAVLPKYLHSLLRTKGYATEFRRLSTGVRVGQWDLSSADFESTYYILPPLPEQKAIADYLDKMVAKVDGIIAKRKQQLEELDKLKKSVVYEYVTGKKEVVQ